MTQKQPQNKITKIKNNKKNKTKKIESGLNTLFLSTKSAMVKAWAEGMVDEYETDFAHKIDWEAAKQRAMNPNISISLTSWTTEEKDGWTYMLGVRYFPADKYGPETYDVTFQKQTYLDLKNVKRFRMSAYKDESRRHNKNTELKRGDWVYVFV